MISAKKHFPCRPESDRLNRAVHRRLFLSAWEMLGAGFVPTCTEAEGLMGRLRAEAEKAANQKRSDAAKAQHSGQGKKLPTPDEDTDANKTATKAAELFNTNRRDTAAQHDISPAISRTQHRPFHRLKIRKGRNADRRHRRRPCMDSSPCAPAC
jgi:hypothetical protein